ncbi:MAG TPA: methyltransferase domain-containing protein [Thermoleophilaceae bacterium]|nr:methyltransferase domain-containing protein [Thermoleophilaceae bacterium]
MGGLRRLTPVNRHFGLGRGTPVDRYYIDEFVRRYGTDRIRGRVLEVGERLYVREPGAFAVREDPASLPPVRAGVEQVDVLDVSASNPEATIVADLGDREAQLPEDAFDCILCIQVLQFVYGLREALENLHRALRPGGSLLVTVPGISQVAAPEVIVSPGLGSADYDDALRDFWRLTRDSAAALCGEVFGPGNVIVESYGNVLASIAFLHGMTVEELRAEELAHNDPGYPLLVGICATKPSR